MADIFLSYASEDRSRVKPLVDALEADGFSVWWDRNIQAGAAYDREIEAAIDDASCVVVVWSHQSVDSDYVRSEVEEAARRDILVPVSIDDALPPLAHRRRQAANLAGWKGETSGEYATLIDGIRSTASTSLQAASGRAEHPPTLPRTDSPSAKRSMYAAAIALTLGLAWWFYERANVSSTQEMGSIQPRPVVLLMDTLAVRGVYDQATVTRSETNADELARVLADLPIDIHKETLGSDWGREHQIARRNPTLVMIHRSAFFHAMNAEFGFSYENEAGYDERRWRLLYNAADNKLIAFLGFVGVENPDTQFLIYSRGTGGGWSDQDFRDRWQANAERRFPFLKGRVFTMPVPGGVIAGSFTTPEAMEFVRETVSQMIRPYSETLPPAQ